MNRKAGKLFTPTEYMDRIFVPQVGGYHRFSMLSIEIACSRYPTLLPLLCYHLVTKKIDDPRTLDLVDKVYRSSLHRYCYIKSPYDLPYLGSRPKQKDIYGYLKAASLRDYAAVNFANGETSLDLRLYGSELKRDMVIGNPLLKVEGHQLYFIAEHPDKFQKY